MGPHRDHMDLGQGQRLCDGLCEDVLQDLRGLSGLLERVRRDLHRQLPRLRRRVARLRGDGDLNWDESVGVCDDKLLPARGRGRTHLWRVLYVMSLRVRCRLLDLRIPWSGEALSPRLQDGLLHNRLLRDQHLGGALLARPLLRYHWRHGSVGSVSIDSNPRIPPRR